MSYLFNVGQKLQVQRILGGKVYQVTILSQDPPTFTTDPLKLENMYTVRWYDGTTLQLREWVLSGIIFDPSKN